MAHEYEHDQPQAAPKQPSRPRPARGWGDTGQLAEDHGLTPAEEQHGRAALLQHGRQVLQGWAARAAARAGAPTDAAHAAHDGHAAPATVPTTRTEDVDVTVDVVVNGHVTTEVAEHLRVPEGATERIVVTEHLATQGQGAPALPIAPPVPAPGAAHHAPPDHTPAPQPAPQPDATGQHPGPQHPAPATVPLYVETQDPTYVGAHLRTQPNRDAPLVPLSTPYIPIGSEVEANSQPVITRAGEQWYHVTYQGVHQGYVLGTLLSRNRPSSRSGQSAGQSTVAPGHAALPGTMQPSAHCYAMIEGFEGWMPHLYDDGGKPGVGNCTIGYGHLVHYGPTNGADPSERPFSTGLTPAQGVALLRSDVATAVSAVRTYVNVPLTQNQFDALVSFTFNVGSGNFARSRLLQDLNKREYDAAAKEFLRWANPNRRAMEAHLFGGQNVEVPTQQAHASAGTSSRSAEGTYIVETGDTLGMIAGKLGVSMVDLEHDNQWLAARAGGYDTLRVGDTLQVPSSYGQTTSAPSQTHANHNPSHHQTNAASPKTSSPSMVTLYIVTQDASYAGVYLRTQPSKDSSPVPLSTTYIPNGSAVEAASTPIVNHGEQWYRVVYQGTHHGYVLGSFLSRNQPHPHNSGNSSSNASGFAGTQDHDWNYVNTWPASYGGWTVLHDNDFFVDYVTVSLPWRASFQGSGWQDWGNEMDFAILDDNDEVVGNAAMLHLSQMNPFVTNQTLEIGTSIGVSGIMPDAWASRIGVSPNMPHLCIVTDDGGQAQLTQVLDNPPQLGPSFGGGGFSFLQGKRDLGSVDPREAASMREGQSKKVAG